jgi:hypothetical protein
MSRRSRLIILQSHRLMNFKAGSPLHIRNPSVGPRLVAKAWVDPDFKARLLIDGTTAASELDGFTAPGYPPKGGLTGTSLTHPHPQYTNDCICTCRGLEMNGVSLPCNRTPPLFSVGPPLI